LILVVAIRKGRRGERWEMREIVRHSDHRTYKETGNGSKMERKTKITLTSEGPT